MSKKLLLLSLAFGLTVTSFGSNAASAAGRCSGIDGITTYKSLDAQITYNSSPPSNAVIINKGGGNLCILFDLDANDLIILGPVLAEVQSANITASFVVSDGQLNIVVK